MSGFSACNLVTVERNGKAIKTVVGRKKSRFGILSSIIAALVVGLSGCARAQERPIAESAIRIDRKVLIVYLSRTNNTKAVAEMIRDEVGGTIVPIELEKDYPADYKATLDQLAKENETGFLPPLKTRIENIGQYDTVFVGFPTWGMQLPPPVKSFFRQYNLQGKTVIPFNTNAGYGAGSSYASVREMCHECNVLEGFAATGGIERDGVLLAIKGDRANEVRTALRQWLTKIEVIKKNEN